jgi:hypothetical protein
MQLNFMGCLAMDGYGDNEDGLCSKGISCYMIYAIRTLSSKIFRHGINLNTSHFSRKNRKQFPQQQMLKSDTVVSVII